MQIYRLPGILLVSFGLVFAAGVHGQSKYNEWDIPGAMAAVQSVNIDAVVYELSDISSLADASATLDKLTKLETRTDWPLPAREAAILQFTQSLAGLPRDAVAIEVMGYLKTYHAQTLVPHEDHGDTFVPLFNIRGAATGVENGWQRTEFATQATALIEKNPTALVSDYLASTTHNQRYGYHDALQQADLAAVLNVQNIVLDRLDKEPVLTGILGITTAITADTGAIEQLLTHGKGVGFSSALVQLDKQLSRPELASLLDFAIHQAPADNATLAIAAWWPRLSHNPETRDLMMATLHDPQLGASAALALAQTPDLQTIKALQDMASGDSIAAQRAQMALDLNRDELAGERRP